MATERAKVVNVGSGTGQVFRDEDTQNQVNLKTVKAGTGVDVTNNADDVEVAAKTIAQTGLANIPVLDDDFSESSQKPFWTNTEVLTSSDWQFDATNDRLNGIAANNTFDWYRRGIEGNADHQFKFSKNSAGSCGLWFTYSSTQVRAFYDGTDLTLSATGKSDIDLTITLSDPFWIRLVRIGSDFSMYYKQNDADDWTLVGTQSDIALGHDMVASLDSANGAYVHRAILYDNSFVGSPTKAKFVKVIPLTDAATIAVDASLGNLFTVTLGGNRTLGTPTNFKLGQMIAFRFLQDATGGRTLTFSSAYRFSTDIPSPTLSTDPDTIDYLAFVYNEYDDYWDCIGKVFGIPT